VRSLLDCRRNDKNRLAPATRLKGWVYLSLALGSPHPFGRVRHAVAPLLCSLVRSRSHMTIEDRDGRVVCERCTMADGPLTRLRGLLGRRELPPGEGLLLRPTPSIHTWFMRFPIDAVFLDAQLEVVAVRHRLPAWRAAGQRGARAVLELSAGEAARRGIERGSRLRMVPS